MSPSASSSLSSQIPPDSWTTKTNPLSMLRLHSLQRVHYSCLISTSLLSALFVLFIFSTSIFDHQIYGKQLYVTWQKPRLDANWLPSSQHSAPSLLSAHRRVPDASANSSLLSSGGELVRLCRSSSDQSVTSPCMKRYRDFAVFHLPVCQ